MLLLLVLVFQDEPPLPPPIRPEPHSGTPVELEVYDRFVFRLEAIVLSPSFQTRERFDVRRFSLDASTGGEAVFDEVEPALLGGVDITFDLNLFRFTTEWHSGGSVTDDFDVGGASGGIRYAASAVRVLVERPIAGVRFGAMRAVIGPGIGFYNVSMKPTRTDFAGGELEERRRDFNGLFVRLALHVDVRIAERLFLMVGANADFFTGQAQGIPGVVTVGLALTF